MKTLILTALLVFSMGLSATAFADDCDLNPGILAFIGEAELAPLVCAKSGSAYFSNGQFAGTAGSSWYHSNGTFAGTRGSSWYHANGTYAGSTGGTWYHPNGTIAGTVGGSWYHANGTFAGMLF